MKTYLEPSDVDKLELAATNLRDQLLVRLLARVGCRVSEALGITVDDIDLVAGAVTIVHLKTRLNLSCPRCHARLGKRHSFCPSCGTNVTEALKKELEHRRVRTLPLDPDTLAMMKKFIELDGPMVREGRKLLFSINRHRAWQVVSECAQRAGLPHLVNPDTGKARGVSPHRLRDAFAVIAVKADDSGDGLRLLQEHLGHSSFNTTAKYRKVSGEEHRDWYNRLWAKKGTTDG